MKQQTTDQSKCRMCGADVDEVSLNSDSMSVGCLDEWFCSCKCANQAVQDPTFADAAAAVESARSLAFEAEYEGATVAAATAAEIRETIREMLTVWETLTPTQIADALAASSAAADKAEAAFLASSLTWAEYLAAGRVSRAVRERAQTTGADHHGPGASAAARALAYEALGIETAPADDDDSEHSYCVMTVHLVLCGHDCPGCDNSKPAEVCTVSCNGVWYPEECGKRTATGSCPERAQADDDDEVDGNDLCAVHCGADRMPEECGKRTGCYTCPVDHPAYALAAARVARLI